MCVRWEPNLVWTQNNQALSSFDKMLDFPFLSKSESSINLLSAFKSAQIRDREYHLLVSPLLPLFKISEFCEKALLPTGL